MKYSFNITLTDEDYYEFNQFWMIQSHYGKKQKNYVRISFMMTILLAIFLMLLCSEFALWTRYTSAVLALILLVFEFAFTPLLKLSIKSQLKQMKKSGKMPYSPASVIEFYEDRFVEMTAENKTKQNSYIPPLKE